MSIRIFQVVVFFHGVGSGESCAQRRSRDLVLPSRAHHHRRLRRKVGVAPTPRPGASPGAAAALVPQPCPGAGESPRALPKKHESPAEQAGDVEEPRLLLGQHEELERLEQRRGMPQGLCLEEAEDLQREERPGQSHDALAPGDVGVLGKLQRGPRGQDVHDARADCSRGDANDVSK